MTDLQLAMIGVGVALVGGVAIYNTVQERRARKGAEKAFGERPPDALFESARREPVLGRLPADERVEPSLSAPQEARVPADDADLEAGVAPTAEISTRIDTVAVILADDPVTREQLQPLLDTLGDQSTPVHVEGIVDEQWHPLETSPRGSWRELRVGLQLASRRGPVPEDAIEAFNSAVADFCASINAVSQREAPAAAALRATDLDRFCADTDIEVAVNVIGTMGTTFALARVKALALEHGLSETAEGDLLQFGRDGQVEFAVRPSGDTISLALDVPKVGDAPGAFNDMVRLAQLFASTLGGELVDDNRKPLTDAGLVSIRRSVESVFQAMEARGVPAGSALARRLFS
ncbi:MAG: cell division protein ZipA C-terminal FtsZ-binding domain-containing protein [Bacillota bacterium]